jgi:hypothetical protein
MENPVPVSVPSSSSLSCFPFRAGSSIALFGNVVILGSLK